ncbi:hypothetical protein IM40_03995 [Candidatus Paracaedimonas acanthamoebae]|nr:hypothetical protein IM40_03995 [Candidatus Paracaedimonas acanthamoebae]
MPEMQDPFEMNYYKLSLLKEEMASQIKDLQKTIDEVKAGARMFMVQHEEFKTIASHVQKSLKASILDASQQMGQEVTDKIEEQIKETFEEAAQNLLTTSQSTEGTLLKAQKALSLRNWLIGATTLVASLLTALSLSYFYLAKIESIATRQLVKTYKYGLLLKDIWPKLSAKDQKKFSQFLEDKEHKFKNRKIRY